MLIEGFFAQETGRGACGKIGAEILGSTSHLVRARSAAVAAAGCVFQARLGETMGVRGFYHSVLPGKGAVLHLLLALSFPRAFREFVRGGFSAGDWLGRVVGGSIERLAELGFEEELSVLDPEGLRAEASQMLSHGLEFVAEAFKAMHGDGWRDALARSVVLVENHMLSYTLHIWGVPDVIVEDPATRTAAVVEWKTYAPSETRSADVDEVDEAQAYVYALLEAERLEGPASSFEDLRRVVLGDPPGGSGARVVPGVVRLVRTARASPVRARHPLLCLGYKSIDKCGYDTLSLLLARIVLAAEHLTLTVTDVSDYLRRKSVPEALCNVRSGGRERVVFRRIPHVTLDGLDVRLLWGNPLRNPLPRLCARCIPGVREVCKYYLSKGGSILDQDDRLLDKAVREALENAVSGVWREAWKARFSVYRLRENALRPYKVYRENALRFGPDGEWIKGSLKTRVLEEGYRLDYFDEARVVDGELVLKRRPMRWEVEKGFLVTLREGKPAAVLFREEHVRDPLLRLGFHGTVSSARFDPVDGTVTVVVSPANKPSRIYPEILQDLLGDRPEVAQGVVAMEVNVDLTQLELLGITAAELGTAARLASGAASEPEDILALYFGGVPRHLRGGGGSGEG